MIWANFLHFYQPPTQKPFWVRKITHESYRKIVEGLLAHPEARLTLNVNAVLVELLDKYDGKDVIAGIKKLLARGQIELTGSAKFHPLLPKIPAREAKRQIALNDATHRKYFGKHYHPRGFFPPEMAFSVDVAKLAKDAGFEWVIVDELSFPPKKMPVDYSKIYTVKGLDDFMIFFRERRMSYKILSGQLGTGNLLVQSLGDRLKRHEYLLTAMDGETFGHHRPGMEHLLFEIYQSQTLKTCVISDLKDNFEQREAISPLPSTWALMEKDLEKRTPFARWLDRGNIIHTMQWELANLAMDTVHRYGHNRGPVRAMLDRAIHSDQFWWASAKPWWSLEMIERGAKELRDVVLETRNTPARLKQRAHDLYQKILYTGFDWQREGIVEALAKQEDEEIRQRTDEGMPQLPKHEVEKIIDNLSREIRVVVRRQEFERAAQLRDRVLELRRYITDNKSKKKAAR